MFEQNNLSQLCPGGEGTATDEAGAERVWRADAPHTKATYESDAFDDSLISTNWYMSIKHGVEWLAALVMLIIFSPIIGLSALLVKLTSRGPALYSQTRLGLHGKHFRIHKIRTMRHNCESATGATWATNNDPRITRVGAFLRKTHLDELPQLFNVLQGDMSLVGPRPERPEFLGKLEEALPHYRDRLLVRPGVTGLAQVQLPADTDLASVRRKLAYDLYYIRYLSFWLDVRLIACTAVHCVGVPFHVLCRMFGMPRRDEVEQAYRRRRSAQVPALVTLQPT